MSAWKRLLSDDGGAILSSELVLVGTLGVIGATVGLGAVATAVNEELEDVAFAIRSLDQSYEIREVRGCNAWTAGSSFRQEPVEKSLRELDEQIDRDEHKLREQLRDRDHDGDRDEHERRDDDRRRNFERRPEKKDPDARRSDDAPQPSRGKPHRRDDEEVVL